MSRFAEAAEHARQGDNESAGQVEGVARAGDIVVEAGLREANDGRQEEDQTVRERAQRRAQQYLHQRGDALLNG